MTPKIETLKKTSHSQIALHIGLLIALIIAYYPVLRSLAAVWLNSDEYSHGFFIIPISLYIVWQNRTRLASIEPTNSWKGIALLLAALVIYALASLMRITTIVSLTFPLSISGLILFLYGGRMLRELAFPILFLLLMIPVPEQIYSAVTIHLQLLVSRLSVFIVSALGIPILREGNVIQLPGKTLEVVQACSGIRSLISLFTLCLVIGYFTLKSNTLRSIMCICAIPVAVLVNVLRILVMVLAFYYFGYDLTVDPVHSYFGIAIFIIAFGIVFSIYKGLSNWGKSARKESV
jgi:exosortase